VAFQGHSVEWQLGSLGMDSRRSTTRLTPGAFTLIENADFTVDTLKKRGGNVPYNATPASGSPRIVGMGDFWIGGTTQKFLVATGDGKLYVADGGAISTTYKTGLGTNKLTHFTQAFDYTVGLLDKAFSYNGFNAVQVYDGSGVADLATPPADWGGNNQPKFGLQGHVLRHWAFGNANRPSFLYYSATNNPTNFTAMGSGFFDVYGQPITGLGEHLTRLFVFSENRIFYVDTSAFDTAAWKIIPLDAGGGTRSTYSVLNIPNDLLFMGLDGGIRSLVAVQTFGDFTQADVSGPWLRDWINAHVNLNALEGVRAMYDPIKRVVFYAVPIDSSDTNNALIKGALPTLQNPEEGIRWSVDTSVRPCSFLMRKEGGTLRPYYGDYAGKIHAMDQVNLNDDGAGYTVRALSGDHNLGLPKVKKIFRSAEIIFRPQGGYNAEFDYYIDFAFRRTVQFRLDGQGETLDEFELDEDELAESGMATARIPLTGHGEFFKFELRQAGLNQGFEAETVRINFGAPAGYGA